MQIEFTVSGLKPTQRRRRKPTREPRSITAAVETIVLAYQIEQAVGEGRARNYAEVAHQIGMTRARVSQILRLLRLPPALIETLLLSDPAPGTRLTERELRSLAVVPDPMSRLDELSRALEDGTAGPTQVSGS
jgi:hypothetical protein